ncbi:MAG: nicotinate-nucleotide adenylyltransferase [Planctomycetota bacterium]
MIERLGLYGGTFNPIHDGHLHVARSARSRFGLDRVWLIPSHVPPHRSSEGLVDAEHRLGMIRAAVADDAGLEASDIEVRRPGRSYTIDTIREVSEAMPETELYFVIGSDSLPELPSWREAKALVSLCQIITVLRRGHPATGLDRVRAFFGDALTEKLESGFLELDPVPVSSTEIRERLRRGESIRGLVPVGVAAYIAEHDLYR